MYQKIAAKINVNLNTQKLTINGFTSNSTSLPNYVPRERKYYVLIFIT